MTKTFRSGVDFSVWRDRRLPFLLLWLGMTISHLFWIHVPHDEVFYGSILGEHFDLSAMFVFLGEHYQTWSARLLIEALFCVFSWLPPLVWRLLNPLLILLAARSLSRLLRLDDVPGCNWVLCLLVFLYQWAFLSDAGWIITTICYLWPIAFGLTALLAPIRALRQQPVSVWQWIGSTALLLVAANMELAAIVLLLIYTALTGQQLVRRQKVSAWLWVQLALVAASLVFIFTCPGNTLRTENDVASFYPSFDMLSLLQKAELGISSAITENVYGRDSIFYLFALLGCIALWQQRAPLLARLLGLLPPLLLLPLSIFRYQLKEIFPPITFFTEAFSASGFLNLSNFGSPMSYLPMLCAYGLFALCLLNVFAAFGFGSTTVHIWALVLLGGISRSAMGFTPSIGVSGGRTGVFFSFCLIAATCLLYKTLRQQGFQNKFLRGIWIAACFYLGAVQAYSMWQLCTIPPL